MSSLSFKILFWQWPTFYTKVIAIKLLFTASPSLPSDTDLPLRNVLHAVYQFSLSKISTSRTKWKSASSPLFFILKLIFSFDTDAHRLSSFSSSVWTFLKRETEVTLFCMKKMATFTSGTLSTATPSFIIWPSKLSAMNVSLASSSCRAFMLAKSSFLLCIRMFMPTLDSFSL